VNLSLVSVDDHLQAEYLTGPHDCGNGRGHHPEEPENASLGTRTIIVESGYVMGTNVASVTRVD
jgi:hypothetical protein